MKKLYASFVLAALLVASGPVVADTTSGYGLTAAQAKVCAKSPVNSGLERACEVVTNLRDGLPPPMQDGPIGGGQGNNGFGNDGDDGVPGNSDFPDDDR